MKERFFLKNLKIEKTCLKNPTNRLSDSDTVSNVKPKTAIDDTQNDFYCYSIVLTLIWPIIIAMLTQVTFKPITKATCTVQTQTTSNKTTQWDLIELPLICTLDTDTYHSELDSGISTDSIPEVI